MSGSPLCLLLSSSLQTATRGHFRGQGRSRVKRGGGREVLPSTLTLPPGEHMPVRAGPPGPSQGLGQERSPAGLGLAKVRWLPYIIPWGGGKQGISPSGHLRSGRGHMTLPGVPAASGLCPGCEKKGRPRSLVSSLHLLSCYHGLSLTCLGFVTCLYHRAWPS